MRLSSKNTEQLLGTDTSSKNYFEHFCEFWLPIYKHQVIEAKLEENKEALSEIMLNLVKNIHLTNDEKNYIAKRIGIYYLIEEKENQDNNNDIRNELFKKHEGLIYMALKNKHLFYKREELYDIGMIGLVNGINTYKQSKGYKESTYIYKCISNEINKYIYTQERAKRKCTGTIISLDKEMEDSRENISNMIADESQDIEKEILRREQKDILYKTLEKLKPEWKYILEKKYGLHDQREHKQSEIAEHFGITKQAISRKEKLALKELKKIILEERMEVFEK